MEKLESTEEKDRDGRMELGSGKGVKINILKKSGSMVS